MDGWNLGASRVAVIYNPASGRRGAAEAAQIVLSALTPRAASVTPLPLRKGSDLTALARRAAADHDVVVAIGGDGTQAAVAQALAGGAAVMGVVPTGTFNYFARDLDVGETAEAALETLLTGSPRAVTLARINERIFLNNVSFGAYPSMLRRREEAYSRFGRSRLLAYLAGLWALRDLRRPVEVTAVIDGQTRHFRSALIFAGRSPTQLEGIGLGGAEAARAGRIPVFVAKAQTARGLLVDALRLATGRASRGAHFDMITADTLTLHTRPARRRIAHDGELSRMRGPFRLEALPGALKVIQP